MLPANQDCGLRVIRPRRGSQGLAARVGIGLRSAHYARFLDPDESPHVEWLEVHAENHFLQGSIRRHTLCAIAERYPISVHGVSLSLGSPAGIDAEHLERLAALVHDVRACRVSEHLAWSRLDGVYYSDLLPLPLTEESLEIVVKNVERVQARLDRSILIENPAGYLQLPESTLTEPEFLSRLVARTGCGLLVDLNNLYVSAVNLGIDSATWLAGVPASAIGEIHLAGHELNEEVPTMLIDSHGAAVSSAVWSLYADLIELVGPRPALIEWDSHVPALEILLEEAARAQLIMGSSAS